MEERELYLSLKENWTNNVIAVALIDTDFNENGFVLKNGKSIFDIDGVPVVANADSIIGWIRTASLMRLISMLSQWICCPNITKLLKNLRIWAYLLM